MKKKFDEKKKHLNAFSRLDVMQKGPRSGNNCNFHIFTSVDMSVTLLAYSEISDVTILLKIQNALVIRCLGPENRVKPQITREKQFYALMASLGIVRS